MSPLSLALLFPVAQRTALFATEAPSGTGLEWLTVGSLVVPAILLIVLIMLGMRRTV